MFEIFILGLDLVIGLCLIFFGIAKRNDGKYHWRKPVDRGMLTIGLISSIVGIVGMGILLLI